MTCLEERLAAVFGTLTRGDEQPCSWTLSRGVPFNPGRSLAVDDSEEDEVAPQIMPQHAIDSPERDDGLYGSGPGEGQYPGGEEAPRACHTSAYRRQFEVEQEEDAYDQLADGGWCPGGLPQDAPPPGDTEVVEDNVYDRMCIQAGSRVTAAAAAADADDAMAIDAVATDAASDTATAGGALATAAWASACAAAGTLASSSKVTPFQPPLTLPLLTQALPVVGATAEAANSETPGKNLVEQQGAAEVPEAGEAGGSAAGGPGLKGLDIEGMGRGGRVLLPPAQPLADPSAMPSLPDPPSPMRRESDHGGQGMTTIASNKQQQQEGGGAESDRHGCPAARPAKAIKRVHWQDDRPPAAEPAPKHGRDGSSSSSSSGRAAQPGLRSASILLPPAPGTACPAAGQLPRALLPAPHFTKGAAGGAAGAGGEERVGTRSKRGRRGQGPPMLAWQQPGYVPDHVRNPHKYKVYDLGESLVVGGGERLQGKQGVQDVQGQQGQQGAGGGGLDGLAGRHQQQGVGPGSVVGEGSVQPAQLPAGQQGEAEGVGVEEGGAAQPPGLKAVKFQPRGSRLAAPSAKAADPTCSPAPDAGGPSQASSCPPYPLSTPGAAAAAAAADPPTHTMLKPAAVALACFQAEGEEGEEGQGQGVGEGSCLSGASVDGGQGGIGGTDGVGVGGGASSLAGGQGEGQLVLGRAQPRQRQGRRLRSGLPDAAEADEVMGQVG